MNRLVQAVVFSLSTALVAAPAFAAPQNSHDNKQHATQNHNDANHKYTHNDSSSHHAQDQHKASNNKAGYNKPTRPSTAWKAGNPVPSQYRGKGYYVDYHQHKKLYKPGKNEQWIHVNGDYVLTNMLNHNIIKIVPGM
ncbi:RcnB family protein [Acinetobacter zhairhuonensis]|jgi:Ni/Co efflux regulator RcnB|uniref:RcnB family protein n=1 Tax=Acinetobacter sp. A7.4 TaxID=2919921 RepID=UPI001F4FF336|nr:RcnB family protein [Acinetobacter sp. A7.4]MCJ8161470.1 RcnB family protein [Acinetobacter sp. A7.4]